MSRRPRFAAVSAGAAACALALVALVASGSFATGAEQSGKNRLPTVKKTWKDEKSKNPGADCPGPYDFSKLKFQHVRGKVKIVFSLNRKFVKKEGGLTFNGELDPSREDLTLAEQALEQPRVRMYPNPSKNSKKWGQFKGQTWLQVITAYNDPKGVESGAGLAMYTTDADGKQVSFRYLGDVDAQINKQLDQVTVKLGLKKITKATVAKNDKLKKLAVGVQVICEFSGTGDIVPGGRATQTGGGDTFAVEYDGNKKLGLVKFSKRRGKR